MLITGDHHPAVIVLADVKQKVGVGAGVEHGVDAPGDGLGDFDGLAVRQRTRFDRRIRAR